MFVLITPVKNEEETIGSVIDSVIEQSVKPDLWIIVNDGSTDQTEKIVLEKAKDCVWIKLVSKEINKTYNWLGYSRVINEGIGFLLTSTLKKLNEFKFIGILDSDITLEKLYFEKLTNFLNNNFEYGVVSGEIYIEKKDGWRPEVVNKSPRGGARIYAAPALNQIGGFPQTPSPDRVSDIKLQVHGFKLFKLEKAHAFQHRPSFGKQNILKAHFSHGRSRYLLDFDLFHVVFISVKYAFQRKPFILSGILFFAGFLSGYLLKIKKIKDPEIRQYSKSFYKRIF
jgi:glycosyltransferase involved in cell wall biosynthesis